MLSFFVAAIFLPMIVSSSDNFDIPYTKFPVGCHSFTGQVFCENGNAVLPEAKVILNEHDPLSDDNLVEAPLEHGKFTIHKCSTDLPTPNLELYFTFVNACQKDSKKQSGILKDDILMKYVIYDGEKFAHTSIN